MLLPYVSVLSKPLVMELVLTGQVKALLPLKVQGIYHLQDAYVNSYPYWDQLDGNNSETAPNPPKTRHDKILHES